MFVRRAAVAFVGVALALSAAFSKAEEELPSRVESVDAKLEGTDAPRDSPPAPSRPSFLQGGWLFGEPFEEMRGDFSSSSDFSVRLSVPKGEEESCRVGIEFGADVSVADVRLVVENRGLLVLTVTFYKEERKEYKNGLRGHREMARRINSSSGVLLPSQCIYNSALQSYGLGGCLVDRAAIGTGRRYDGRVILPSESLLRKYEEQGLLTSEVVNAVKAGQREGLEDLSPMQRCLVAGFTEEECKRIGGLSPNITTMPPGENPRLIPVPFYTFSLRQIEGEEGR